MLKIVVFLWFLAYIIPITRNLVSLRRIKTGLGRLVGFVAIYGNSKPYHRPAIDAYTKELTALLRYYPVISEFVSYPKLSYSHTDEETYQNACKIMSSLQVKLNETRHALFRSFNPLLSVRELILLPAHVLQEIGFRPGMTSTLILNTAGWAISYLLGMFQPEIKALLIALFKKLIGA